MCSELITVDSGTSIIKYALDTFHEGRKSVSSEELLFIWDTLTALIKSGEIKSIIEGNDPTDGMFPVYSCDDGEVVERFADEFGWPHSTHDGVLMYNNTFFRTREEAIKYGIRDLSYGLESITESIEGKEEQLQSMKQRRDRYAESIKHLKAMLPEAHER
jgi:hypothetical protein